MLLLQNAADTLPLWIGSLGEKPPSLCGAIPAEPNYVCKQGDLVAARVKSSEGDDNWILAEVCSTSPSGKYTVEDIDEEQKESHVITRKKVIPVPLMRAHPTLNPEAIFPLDAEVLALYPQTTCFYKGVVQSPPAKPNDTYLVAFEDNSYPQGFSQPLTVPQRYIVSF
ncbi:unnamed protein product [Soboliphyme baturini]|uniref:SGF29 C-terminal domain-containing protein n=1 Tax=Soboliphyme baturini TaxID=241478 RepID=A0A183IMA6_9BILA|nr:unnamed protein product [Soboliphyme baturini]